MCVLSVFSVFYLDVDHSLTRGCSVSLQGALERKERVKEAEKEAGRENEWYLSSSHVPPLLVPRECKHYFYLLFVVVVSRLYCD